MFAEEAPHARLTSSHSREIQWAKSVCKTEITSVTLIQAALTSMLYNIGSIKAVLRIIFRESCYAGTVCMCRDISVGNTDCNPNCSLIEVYPVLIFWFAGNYVHEPYLILVGKRDGLSTWGIAVLICKGCKNLYSLPGTLCPLQGNVNERAVIQHGSGIPEFRSSAPCRFSNKHLVLIHIPDNIICIIHLRNITQEPLLSPLPYLNHFTPLVEPAGHIYQCTVTGMWICRIAHHHRSVFARSLGNQQVCAGKNIWCKCQQAQYK